jgi:hypothetical protein
MNKPIHKPAPPPEPENGLVDMDHLPAGIQREQVEADLALAAREVAGEAIFDADSGPVTPEERRRELEEIASQLSDLHGQLKLLLPELSLDVDQRAVAGILTDLAWAVENCTVIAKHQTGDAMDDEMGTSSDGKVR